MTPQHDIIEKYSHRFPGPRYIETKGGWNKLIVQFLDELETLDPAHHITLFCIKEKFGYIRINDNGVPELIFQAYHDLERKYEKLSVTVCEDCGQPGRIRHGGWIRTACDAHAK